MNAVSMIELPTLLLTANVSSVFKICAELEEAVDPVVCDASRLIVVEPMALCALVATLSRMQRVGRNELIDNGLRHGRGRGYEHASVWLAAQYHPPMGLIRIAVVDDGCGFLKTFQGRNDLELRSHADAVRAGFKPFTSSKRDVGLFADSQHQGLGLTICRDLAHRSEGSVAIVAIACR
jgi:signal transduction histidine kinase